MIQVRRPAFATRAVILLVILFAGMFAFFMVPPFRSFVTTIGTNLRTILGGLVSGFTASQFYITIIQPRLLWVGIAIGAAIVGLIAIFGVKGYLGFIKLGRQKSDELSGLQTRPLYTPQVIPQAATPIPQPQQEKEQTSA